MILRRWKVLLLLVVAVLRKGDVKVVGLSREGKKLRDV